MPEMQRYEVTVRATRALETVIVLDAHSDSEALDKAEDFAFENSRHLDWEVRGPVEDISAYSADEVDEDEPITNVRGFVPR